MVKDEIIYVIGHKSPDADSVGSAIAYSYLLNKIGIKALPAVSSKPNKETLYALKEFKIEIPIIINDALDKQFVLVDHSEYSQAIYNMDKAKVIRIIDHHQIGDIGKNSLIDIKYAHMGSTASIIYMMYQEKNIIIPVDIARVMLMGLISDTNNGTNKMTEMDYIIYDRLKELAHIDVQRLYEGMQEARLSYQEMTDEEIFMSDYKEYLISNKKIGMSSVIGVNSKDAKDLAKRLYDYMRNNMLGMDILLLKVSNNDINSNEKDYMVAYPIEGVELLNKAFNNYDGNFFFIFHKNVSRKNDIIPKIREILNDK